MTDAPSPREFFNRRASEYHGGAPGPMAPFHRRIARQIEHSLDGEVLAVGGLWAQADLGRTRCEITVSDVSDAMLEHWSGNGLRTVRCDARELEFGDASFGAVVLPLVLHHIAGAHGLQARREVARVLGEAFRVLRPGGGVWISEFCVSRAVYALELAASPLTARLLRAARVPLVVMHTATFYLAELERAGFHAAEARRIEAPEAHPLDAIRPVIGLPWLRVPRFTYPVHPTLITARR